jgi:hypothetical protein
MRTPASFARLIRFDRPGTGASDPLSLGSLPPATAGVRRAHQQQGRPVLDRLNGVPVNPNRSHRIIVNSFLADGGDNFTVLTQGTTVWAEPWTWMCWATSSPPTDLSPRAQNRVVLVV